MKKLFSVIVLMFCIMQTGYSQEDVITFSGTKHYKMSKADIVKELVGKYCIYRPSEDGVWFDPDDGTTGLIVNEDGFTLVGNFAQTIYPARGTGNIDGSITDEARYYDGVWYKGHSNDGAIWYLLTRFKRSIDVMNFSNSQWIGNNTINYDASNNSAIILQYNPDGVWCYRCNMGDFPFKKSEIAAENIVEVVDAKSLQDSGLSVEEWAIGKWKAIITKEQRRADIIESLECADYTLSDEEIEKQLTFYEKNKTFYLEITKEYLQYQFPIPITDGVGGVVETCNDFSIQHEYTIVDGKYGNYDIKVGDKIIASFGKYSKGISIGIDDGFEIYGIGLERVNELGEIESSNAAVATVAENSDVANVESTNTQQSEKIASINEGQKGIEGYEWLEGEWEYSTEYDWAKVVITPTAYKMVNSNLNQGVEDILFELERPLSINYTYNYILDKEILVLDSENPLIGIDYEEQKVYVILGEYNALFLNKVNNGLGKYWKNISWVYGEWKVCSNNQLEKDYFVKITPFYYQISIDNVSSTEDKFAGQPKKQYRAKLGYDNSLGYCVYIDNLLLDLEAKRVYCVPGFEMKIPMEQTVEYTTIQIIYWTIIGFLGVGILLCLYFLFRKLGSAIISFGKKFINAVIGAFRKINTAIKAFSGNVTKVISSVPKKVVATAKMLKENSNNDSKKRKLSTTSWCVIAGLYILMFWDITVGFLILLMTLAYVIVQKKVAPETKEKILACCKDKLRPVISEPMLAKGLTWLVVGVLIYRIFSGFIGFLIIVCSIIFLVLMKFAPSVSEKVYGYYEKIIFTIKPILRKKWWKIAAILCLIILPLSMSMQQSSVFSLTPIGNEIQEYHIKSKINKLEEKEKDGSLSRRDYLRKEYLRLKRECEDAQIRMYDYSYSSSYEDRREAAEDYERIQSELDELERQAQAMGIPALIMLI